MKVFTSVSKVRNKPLGNGYRRSNNKNKEQLGQKADIPELTISNGS